jgi:hypothetical protein
MTPTRQDPATQSRRSTEKPTMESYGRSKVTSSLKDFDPIAFHHAINEKSKQIVLIKESHTHYLSSTK